MVREAGFTIIELIIVIIVIGILTTIGVASLTNSFVTRRDDERTSDIASIARLLEQDYSNQVVSVNGSPSPSYPFTNNFVSDANTLKDTAANADAGIFSAPGSSDSNLVAATSNDPLHPRGANSPALNDYVYQPLASDGSLCGNASQACVSFKLFFLRETGNCPATTSPICITRSLHQQ